MIVGCLIVVALCFGPSPLVTSSTLALVLVCVAIFFLLASYQYQSLVVALVPESHRGRLAGAIQMCSTVAGIVAPIVTGAVVESTGSYTPAFLVGGALAVVGALAVLVLVRDKRTVPSASQEAAARA